jgi:hypothetical protein
MIVKLYIIYITDVIKTSSTVMWDSLKAKNNPKYGHKWLLKSPTGMFIAFGLSHFTVNYIPDACCTTYIKNNQFHFTVYISL